MPVNTRHPEYVKHVENWTKVRDAVEGDLAIRRNVTDYLPVPPGLSTAAEVLETGKRVSTTRYWFYARLAEWPEIVSPTLNGILGLIHEKKPEVKLPKDMEYLIEDATPTGMQLDDLWEMVTKEMFVTGRSILLGEIYDKDSNPRLCLYPTESMINWRLLPERDGGQPEMVVFEEHKWEPKEDDEFSYENVTYYRLLQLVLGSYTVRLFKLVKEKIVEVKIDEENYAVKPMYLGATFDYIPITTINALDLGYDYGPVPLLPMTNRAISIFRRSADYNRSLYIKGDPQVVLTGVSEDDIPTDIGGGTVWAFSNPMARANYLDIDGQGIPLMRQSIEDQFARFADEVGMLLEGSSTGYESGEAIRRKQAMRQVTVKSVIINAAEGMEKALRMLARMKGKSDTEIENITFSPNIDFNEPIMTGAELRELITSKTLGAPLSEQTLHDLMRRRQITEMSYVEERALLDEEKEKKLEEKLAELEAMQEMMPPPQQGPVPGAVGGQPPKALANKNPALPGMKGRPGKDDPRTKAKEEAK